MINHLLEAVSLNRCYLFVLDVLGEEVGLVRHHIRVTERTLNACADSGRSAKARVRQRVDPVRNKQYDRRGA